jgi:hypothetical protein
MMNDEGKEQLITAEQKTRWVSQEKRCEESKEGSFVARQRDGRARQGLAAWDWKFFHHHSRAPALCSFWCTARGWFLSPCSITYRRRNGMRGMVVLVGGLWAFFFCIGGVSCPPLSVARIFGAGQILRLSHSRATGQATAHKGEVEDHCSDHFALANHGRMLSYHKSQLRTLQPPAILVV